MIQDIYATFDDKADISLLTGTTGVGATGTFQCNNSYDTGAAGVPNAVGVSNLAFGGAAGSGSGTIGGPLMHDIGRGRRVSLVVQIEAAFVGTSGLVEVDFLCADSADLKTTNAQVLLKTPAIAVASLVAGYRFPFGSIPGKVPRRYVGTQYVVTTTAMSAGTFSSFLALDVDDHADVIGA
jgi:hypothetical protein